MIALRVCSIHPTWQTWHQTKRRKPTATGHGGIERRSSLGGVRYCSAQLRRLSDEYGVSFALANQATAALSNRSGLGGGGCSSNNMVPALGLSWSNCISTRFILRRSESLESRLGATSSTSAAAAGKGPDDGTSAAAQSSMFNRLARFAKSSVLPPVSVPVAIAMRGGVAKEKPK